MQCYGRDYREMSSRGVAVRRSSASATPQEAARRQLAERMEKRDQVEQQRRDRALLQSYASEDELRQFTERRKREADAALEGTRQQLREAQARQMQLEGEARGKNAVPASVQESLRANEAEIRRLESLKVRREGELAEASERAKADVQRYRELTLNNQRLER